MENNIKLFQQSAEKTLQFLKEDLKSIRTGKANPALLDNLVVEAYGGQSKLKLLELASILTDGPAALSINPFDPSVLSDIEKAIIKSTLGITAVVQGNRLIAKIPPLTQEQREKFVKLVNLRVEEKKNVIRSLRDEARKKIKQSLETKAITEDQKFKFEKELDNINQTFMQELLKIKENKEREIMEL